MASSIHHGPPGSFKSFTLVQRFAIDALKEGRVVVTNIRGLTSLDRILDQFPEYEFPETAGLVHVSSENAKGRAIMAGWFHWVPMGALILMDEGQRIYPDRRDFKLESLDKHVSPENYVISDIHVLVEDEYTGETEQIGRPEDVFTAFDMQRHFQWDIFISTTHINKIQKPIKQASQTAYLHKSLSGKLPFLFKDTWYEFQHDPETTGKLLSHRIGKTRKYKADTRIYQCYRSTATGEHTESKADQSVLGDSGVRFKLFVMLLAIGTSIYFLFHFSAAHEAIAVPVAASDQKSPALQPQDNKTDSASVTKHDSVHVPNQQTDMVTRHVGKGNVESVRWRIVGSVIRTKGEHKGEEYVYIQDATKRPRRIDVNLCKKEFKQIVSCMVDEQLVTVWSGAVPSVDNGSGSLLAGLSNGRP